MGLFSSIEDFLFGGFGGSAPTTAVNPYSAKRIAYMNDLIARGYSEIREANSLDETLKVLAKMPSSPKVEELIFETKLKGAVQVGIIKTTFIELKGVLVDCYGEHRARQEFAKLGLDWDTPFG